MYHSGHSGGRCQHGEGPPPRRARQQLTEPLHNIKRTEGSEAANHRASEAPHVLCGGSTRRAREIRRLSVRTAPIAMRRFPNCTLRAKGIADSNFEIFRFVTAVFLHVQETDVCVMIGSLIKPSAENTCCWWGRLGRLPQRSMKRRKKSNFVTSRKLRSWARSLTDAKKKFC